MCVVVGVVRYIVCDVVITVFCDYVVGYGVVFCFFFFFQAEDGIRDLVRSRGLGDVYKRQCSMCSRRCIATVRCRAGKDSAWRCRLTSRTPLPLSLIHI